ncbi:MAG: hypothetical protein AB1656_09180 [Candidatus Omnitrophota bacterium]
MKKTISFQTKHLLLDGGEIIPALVRCAPGEPMDIVPGQPGGADIQLPDPIHIALARADTHVHFRESYIPSREEFENDPYRNAAQTYEQLLEAIRAANTYYDVRRGSLAALKGGVWLAGAMGNTPWAPLGRERWEKTQRHYQQQALIYMHVWPRMEPGVPPIEGQEEKDFGSTFGGSGINGEQRRRMYLERKGGMVSYHNDQPREEMTIDEFQHQYHPPAILLHHLYYDGETVLAAQRTALALAREAELSRLHTRHIPTGAALEMILGARREETMDLPAEVGLDYLYFNRDMLLNRNTSSFNFRRPALPSQADQAGLIELTRECARRRDPRTFIGSDQAPHPRKAKAPLPNGLPGSPGTRVLAISHQIHTHLIKHCSYTFADIDWLTAITPAKYIAQYRPFPFPIGTMANGAMANLVIFDPDVRHVVDEEKYRKELRDPEYQSAYRDETLFGEVLYTVVNGVIYDVRGEIVPLNAEWGEMALSSIQSP